MVAARNRVAIAIYSVYLGFRLDPVFYFKRGYAFSELGGVENRRSAIADYDKALTLSPQFKLAYQARAVSKALLGDYSLAIEDLDQCISIDPTEGGCYRNRGWIKSEYLKEYEAGLADSDLAIKYLPADPVSYANRAEDYYHLGRFSASCVDFRKAFELGYSTSVAWTNESVKRFASGCRS